MNNVDQYLADKMIANQISLFRFTAGERKKVLALLSEMQRELRIKLLGDLTDFSKRRVNKLIKEAGGIIADYYGKSGRFLDGPGLAMHEATKIQEAFAVIGLDIAIPSESALRVIASNVLIEGAPSAAWWAKAGEDLSFKFAAQVRQGIVQAETVQQIVARVIGSPAKGIPGIMDTSRRGAAALVHTSVQQVANDARLATFRENSDVLKGVKHLSTLDSHTSLQCVARSGAEWDLDGSPIKGGFPFKSPPLHFNCRSVLVGITKSYRDLGIDIDEVPTGTRSSDLGQIPADTTFEGFLKRHDKAYVDELLGPGRADLWRKGKITLQDLVDGNGRELTLKELRALK
jgi:hypothetical protein